MSPPRFSQYPIEDFRAQHREIEGALHWVCQSGNYILGEEVAAFEGEFAEWLGARHVIGVGSGSDAIEIMLRGLGIGTGDAVVLPSHTAVACVCAVARAGANPVLVDVDPATFTMQPESVEEMLKKDKSVKAVLAVHLYGHPAGMAFLQSVCDRHGVILLEDCAQAHGATWRGHKAGTLAHAAAFSFYPTKNLGALGDGGAVVTDNHALAMRVREIRQHGWRERWISAVEGVNSRLDELQAAVLRVKLRSLDGAQAARQRLAMVYTEGLRGVPGVITPVVRHDCGHAFHLYVIRAHQRDALSQHLAEAGVPVARHYPAAIHQQPAYRGLLHGPLPHTEKLVQEILTLPLHPYLSEDILRHVVDVIRRFPKP